MYYQIQTHSFKINSYFLNVNSAAVPSGHMIRDGSPHQGLVDARWRPVVRGGVESRVFARHDRIGHDHAVPLVHPQAAAPFDLGRQVSVWGVREEAPHSLVVLLVVAGGVVNHAAAARHTGFPEGQEGKKMTPGARGFYLRYAFFANEHC